MNTTVQVGTKGQVVVQLQQFLNCKGYFIAMDGNFGLMTEKALIQYQEKNGMTPNGIADQDFINIFTAPDNLDKWCLAIKNMEGFFAPDENAAYPNGTPAWANNNPGNLVFLGETNAVANGRFAKFETYQDGYNALKELLIHACTGQSKVYRSTMTLLEFQETYSPPSDNNDPVHYATTVANAMGVTIETVISSLI